jgi:hypothetical protein
MQACVEKQELEDKQEQKAKKQFWKIWAELILLLKSDNNAQC